MAHTAHLVFKPTGQTYDLSGLLIDAPSYIIAKEYGTINMREHYHICFRTDACEQTIRTRILSTLQIPKTGRGKGNMHYTLKWDAYKNWNPEYAAKSGDIVSSLGFTPDEIEDAIFRGSIKYNKVVDQNGKGTSIDLNPTVQAATMVTESRETQDAFDRLLIDFEKSDSRDDDVINVKRWIKSHYLRRRKAIPRAGDLGRWAYSLYAIVRNKCNKEDQQVLEVTIEPYL